MKKIVVYLSLISLFFVSFSTTVYARDYSGDELTFNVTYDGTNFTGITKEDQERIDDILANAEPGDTVTIVYNFTNTSSDQIDLYMRNTSKKFEDDPNLGAFYTYKLDYKGNTVSVIFNSDVGGESEVDDSSSDPNQGNQGIEEATSDLDEFFILDRLSTNQSGTVTMFYSLDGETQDMNYQTLSSDLTVQFAVEPVPEETPEKIVEHVSRVVYIPYTGDTINLNIYIVLEMLSLLLLAVVVFAYYRYVRKQRRA